MNVVKIGSANHKNPKGPSSVPRGSGSSHSSQSAEGPREIHRIILGSRLLHSKLSELWHLDGVLSGSKWETVPIGEFSVSTIPKMSQPRYAVVGYLSPPDGHEFRLGLDEIWNQFKGLMSHLGYDIEGFHGSLSLMGHPVYFEEFEADDEA